MALLSKDSVVYIAFHVFSMCAKSVPVCSVKSYFATIKFHGFLHIKAKGGEGERMGLGTM